MGIKKIIAAAMTIGMVMSFIPSTVLAARTGWEEEGDGWRYYETATEYCEDEWKQIGSYWYYFDKFGYMLADSWFTSDGRLYHFDSNGHMEKNKWVKDVYDGCTSWSYVGSNGAAYTGWHKINKKWYFFGEATCEMYADEWHYDDASKRYYRFDIYGQYLRNQWYSDYYYEDGVKKYDWYYFDANGLSYSGWHKIKGVWYYFDKTECNMLTGYQGIGGKRYYFADSGAMRTGWISVKIDDDVTIWLYAGSDGALYQNRWLQSKGVWYYFDEDGIMVYDKTDYEINGRYYDFATSGALLKPYNGRANPSAM